MSGTVLVLPHAPGEQASHRKRNADGIAQEKYKQCRLAAHPVDAGRAQEPRVEGCHKQAKDDLLVVVHHKLLASILLTARLLMAADVKRQSSRCSSLIITKSLLRKNVVSLDCSSKKSRCCDRLRHSSSGSVCWERCARAHTAAQAYPGRQTLNLHCSAPRWSETWCRYA